SSSEDVDMLGLEEVSQTSISEVGLPPEFALPQVLISVAIKGEQMLNTTDWLDWLKNLPAVAKSVRIQGVYKSDSTLLLLILPVALWDVMPDDPAVSFIAFVRTTNLIGQGEARRQSHPTKRLEGSCLESSELAKLALPEELEDRSRGVGTRSLLKSRTDMDSAVSDPSSGLFYDRGHEKSPETPQPGLLSPTPPTHPPFYDPSRPRSSGDLSIRSPLSFAQSSPAQGVGSPLHDDPPKSHLPSTLPGERGVAKKARSRSRYAPGKLMSKKMDSSVSSGVKSLAKDDDGEPKTKVTLYEREKALRQI
ncbi:MAG: hypothetical protein Q9183_007756, partial [Haloplaca sp. 2 TL-2023]